MADWPSTKAPWLAKRGDTQKAAYTRCSIVDWLRMPVAGQLTSLANYVVVSQYLFEPHTGSNQSATSSLFPPKSRAGNPAFV